MPLYTSHPPDSAPFRALQKAGIIVLPESKLVVEPIRILVLNQMPSKTKGDTEVQIGDLLSASGYPIHVTFAVPDNVGKTERGDRPFFSDVRNDKFHGLIHSGAPLEFYSFDQASALAHARVTGDDSKVIKTWDCQKEVICDWSRENVESSIFICIAAQIALWHEYGIEKRLNGVEPGGDESKATKLLDVYPQELRDASELKGIFAQNLSRALAKLPDLSTPVGRFCYVDPAILEAATNGNVETIFSSSISKLGLAASKDSSRIYWKNHPEYGFGSIGKEYDSDVEAGKNTPRPVNYDMADIDRTDTPPWHIVAQTIVNQWITHVADKAGISNRAAAKQFAELVY